MSRANTFRKRAQEHLKKRNWEGAIKEYLRLTELDQSNPNVYNELGDLYLKINQKSSAMKHFETAVEAYARVGLFNNAVAVCKKLLRLQTGNNEIIAMLGSLRKRQGLLKEAATYYVSYLEKLFLDGSADPKEMKKKVAAIAEEMLESVDVLEKAAEYLMKWEFKADGAKVLAKLQRLYEWKGMAEAAEDTRIRISELGYDSEKFQEATADSGIQTNEDLWSKVPSTEGERIEHDLETHRSKPHESPQYRPHSPSKPAREATRASSESYVQDYGAVELDKSAKDVPDSAWDPESDGESGPGIPPEPQQQLSETEGIGKIISGGKTLSEGDVWIPASEVPDPLASEADGDEGKVVHVSQIIDEFKSEVRESIDEEDYRSHYDLGMAYLEMDFLAEAIREFQFAAKSSAFMVKSLEMVGLCFLNQDKPSLAIKQMLMGLEAVGKSDRETLGLRYNLGLAYEMVGDIEKAKNCFEEVYIVDVAFRDVAEKIKKYSD